MPNAPERPSTGPDKRQWFVRMSNGSTFGPINTKGLVFWAEEGRIMPDDEISEDRTEWGPAQELPDLGMDTLIERPDGSFAGPFHPHAIQPLVQEGKIPPNARTFHRDDLPAMLAARQMPLFADPPSPPAAPATDETAARATKAKDPERAALKRENQRLAERVTELESMIDELRVQAKDALAEREREADELRVAVGSLTTERDAAQQTLTQRDADAAALRDDLAALTAQLETARTQLAEHDRARNETNTTATDATLAQQEQLAAEIESLRSSLAKETALRLATEEREAAAVDRVEELKADRDADAARSQRLADELAQAKSDYSDLLAFSNTRDAEYEARLEAAVKSAADVAGDAQHEAPTGDARRIQQLESQLIVHRRELEEARQLLQNADVAATQAARPQEPEIARIETFAEAALATLQSVLEQEHSLNDEARAASAARQEALHAEIDRLQRALRLAPGEATRTQQLEKRNDRLIAKLKQELESARRQHTAELNQAAERQRELEQRATALEKRESAARDQLSRVEQRAADHDSLASQLRRRESALLTAEREFETARQQWQAVETALMRRIEELESGASRLLTEQEGQSGAPARPTTFQAKPWMKLQR
jgi:chromosome segregation ATPase